MLTWERTIEGIVEPFTFEATPWTILITHARFRDEEPEPFEGSEIELGVGELCELFEGYPRKGVPCFR